METVQMRRKIISVYPDSMRWSNRVMNMPDKQVLAIYYSFLKTGRFDELKKKKESGEPTYTQLTIFDYGVKV